MRESQSFHAQVFQLFCEDFKMEDNGQPLITGLLSPEVFGEENMIIEDFYTITFVSQPYEVEKSDIRLTVIEHFEGEVNSVSYDKTLLRPDDVSSGHEWVMILPLRMKTALAIGGMVEAIVEMNGLSYRSTLSPKLIIEDLDNVAVEPNEKTKS